VRDKTGIRKVLFVPAGWQADGRRGQPKRLSSFWETGCRRSGGFDGRLAPKKVLCARQNRIKKSLVCSGGHGSWPVGMAGRLVAVGATKPDQEKSCFPAGQPEEQAAHTPHPLKIFPPGLPDAGRQDRGKNFRPTAGPGLWAWSPKTRSGNERFRKQKAQNPVRKRALSQDGRQNKTHTRHPLLLLEV